MSKRDCEKLRKKNFCLKKEKKISPVCERLSLKKTVEKHIQNNWRRYKQREREEYDIEKNKSMKITNDWQGNIKS